jgi:hypothetical protein
MFDTPYRSLSQSIRENEFLQVSYILLLDEVLLYLMLVIEFDLKRKNAVSTNERLIRWVRVLHTRRKNATFMLSDANI